MKDRIRNTGGALGLFLFLIGYSDLAWSYYSPTYVSVCPVLTLSMLEKKQSDIYSSDLKSSFKANVEEFLDGSKTEEWTGNFRPNFEWFKASPTRKVLKKLKDLRQASVKEYGTTLAADNLVSIKQNPRHGESDGIIAYTICRYEFSFQGIPNAASPELREPMDKVPLEFYSYYRSN